jgi:predicted PurR-regulated permease PerM
MVQPTEDNPRTRELRTIRRLLWIVALLGIVVALRLGAAVFIPLTAAMLLSFLFKPVIRRLQEWGVAPPVTALLIMGGLFLTMLAGAGTATDSVRTWMDQMPEAAERLEERLHDLRIGYHRISAVTEKISDMADGDAAGSESQEAGPPQPQRPRPVPVEIKTRGFPAIVFSTTAGIIAGLTIMLVMSFFMLASGDLLLRQLVQALPALGHKKGAVEAWRDLESHVSAYLATVTMINAVLGLAVWLALWLLGLPNAMWWGLAAMLGNFIPYVGPLLVSVGVFLASLLAFDSLGRAVVVPISFVTITAIEGYFITPMVLGRRLSLNPLVLFVWLVFWGWMWGVAGALMAVPMLVCFKIVCDHVQSLETLSNVLSGYVRRAGDNGSSP